MIFPPKSILKRKKGQKEREFTTQKRNTKERSVPTSRNRSWKSSLQAVRCCGFPHKSIDRVTRFALWKTVKYFLFTTFFQYFEHSSMFIQWWSNSNTWILASNKWTSKIESKRPLLNLLDYSSNRLNHHFSNIEGIWTCSSFANWTQTPYFRLQTIEH